MLAGAVVITAVGVVDDVFELSPLLKLIGQTVAAAIPVLNGVNVAQLHAARSSAASTCGRSSSSTSR